MDLVVFGANGPTGRLVVHQALAAGHHVRAVTRRPDGFPLRAPDLDVVAADVTDAPAVDRAVAGAQAVISTYGVPYSRSAITVYSHGITTITAAMTAHHVSRLVCVTSTTVATGKAPDQPWVARRVLIPFLRHVVGRTLYDDMDRMEDIVRASALDWTIVRPAGLFDADVPTADYQVSAGRLPGRATSRADLAAVLVREATEPQYPHATIEVMTRSGLPSAASFLREALGRPGATSHASTSTRRQT